MILFFLTAGISLMLNKRIANKKQNNGLEKIAKWLRH